MKTPFVCAMIALCAMALLAGCSNLEFGGHTTNRNQNPTIGQQLVDLKHAREVGAITEADYQAEKVKILGGK